MKYMKLRNWIDLDKLDWKYLSANPNAIQLLKENYNKINWSYLSSNPNAISLLKENLDKIDYNLLSSNPNTIELFKENKDKIDYNLLSSNPSIFTYDYDKIKENFKDLAEEIISKALHPKRIFKLIELYGEDEVYNNYFDY